MVILNANVTFVIKLEISSILVRLGTGFSIELIDLLKQIQLIVVEVGRENLFDLAPLWLWSDFYHKGTRTLLSF